MVDKDTHAQALINKGACPACLTYPARNDRFSNESGIAGFCSRPCRDYYLYCQANFTEVRWRRALELAEVAFTYHWEKYGFSRPEEVTL